MSLTISSASTVDIQVPVSAILAGVLHDPTADAVAMAFKAPGTTPTSPDWHTGAWTTYGGVHYALCLIGPGGVALTAGTYIVWVKVTDSPEVPVMPADTLVIV